MLSDDGGFAAKQKNIWRNSKMELNEIYSKKELLEKEIVELDSKLHLARATARTKGIFADTKWFNNANTLLSHKKIELKYLNIKISNRRDGYKRFYEIAKLSLDKETFDKIAGLANVSPQAIESSESAQRSGGRICVPVNPL